MIHDVIVVGAGPAGSVAARVLAAAGRTVAVLAPPDRDRRRVGESLPGAARRVLADAGLLAVLAPHRPHPGTRAAWGGDSLVALDGIRDPYGPGLHLDRVRFDADLRAAAAVDAYPHRLHGCARDGGVWRLATDGPELAARVVIEASGRRCVVARALGVERRRDPPLVAVVAWVRRGPADTDERTLIEAVEHGWFYTAPLSDGSRVVCFHALPEVARAVLREADAWARQVDATTHIAPLIRDAAHLAPRAGREACGATLLRHGGPGWLAVGDAAVSFDPLASQGLFNALTTGLVGARAVDAALAGDPEPGLAYGRTLAAVRRRYLEHCRHYYAQERRWAAAPFWASRRARSTARADLAPPSS